MIKIKKIILLWRGRVVNELILYFLAFSLFSIVFVYSINVNAQKAEFSQAFTTTDSMTSGALVSLSEDSGGSVELSSQDSGNRFVGIYAEQKEIIASINLSPETIQVATSGKAIAFVTDLNGSVNYGDYLSVSAIKGVAKKATTGDRIIGVAQSEFNSGSDGAFKQQVNDVNGGQHYASVGLIPIVISYGSIDDFKSTERGVKGWVENTAGRPLSNIRVTLLILVATVMLIVDGAMVNSATRGTMTGISRNPLAKPAIVEALTQVTVMVLLVTLFGVIIMYSIVAV